MLISNIDHLVITVKSIKDTCWFYETILGLEIISFGDNRKAIKVNDQKINIHVAGNELNPAARYPTPGSADLCFISPDQISEVIAYVTTYGIKVERGPVKRDGVFGEMDSIYIRDPDGNLIEISHYV